MTGIAIRGTGRYLPAFQASNEDYAAFLDTSDEWIRSHTGIGTRRIAVDEPTCYMGAQAAEKAMEAAGIRPEQIDMIIGTTVTGDFRYPSMACLVQHAVGATNAFCMDIAAACAALPYAMDIAQRYLVTGGAETILIVSAESLTQTADYGDRSSCILFGDGAGACIVTRGEGAFGASLHSDGAGARHLYAKNPRMRTPFGDPTIRPDREPFSTEGHGYETPDGLAYMQGHEVYRFASRAMPQAVKGACEKAGFAMEELDLLIPHQANIRIIQAAAKQMKMPMEKVYLNIEKYGNTSSASIAIALDESVREGRLRPGDKVGLVGFGAGLVYGAVVFEYGS